MTTITQNGNDFTVAHLGPQVITIFVPNFNTGKIKMRQMILSDDWVADCQAMDEKYGIWFTTPEQAKEVILSNRI
jgi:hypothetical protein